MTSQQSLVEWARPPCPLCGHGEYHHRRGLYGHLYTHHPALDDRERSEVVQAWLRQGGRP